MKRPPLLDMSLQAVALAALLWWLWPYLSLRPEPDAAEAPVRRPWLDPRRWETGPRYPDGWLDGTVPLRVRETRIPAWRVRH